MIVYCKNLCDCWQAYCICQITLSAARYQSLEETTMEDVTVNQDKASDNLSSLPQNDIHLITAQQLDIGK